MKKLIALILILCICQISYAASDVELILDEGQQEGLEILNSNNLDTDSFPEELNNEHCLSIVSDCLNNCSTEQNIIISRNNGLCRCNCLISEENQGFNRKIKKNKKK